MADKVDYDLRHKELQLPCVRVRAGRAGGSGTVIYSVAGEGDEPASVYVLTNHHVVGGLITVEKKWSPLLQREIKQDTRSIAECHFFRYKWQSRAVAGTTIESDIVGYDVEEDLALLKLRMTEEDSPPAAAKLFPRGQEKKLRTTMPVFAVGAGLGEPPVITGGFISQFGREMDNREFWLFTAPGIYGNSGGSLFLADTHELLGVPARIAVTAMGIDAITHLMYAVPITRIYKFLEEQLFRFIYDSSFTEKGEEKERDKRRKQEEKKMLKSEQRGEEEDDDAANEDTPTEMPNPYGGNTSNLRSGKATSIIERNELL